MIKYLRLSLSCHPGWERILCLLCYSGMKRFGFHDILARAWSVCHDIDLRRVELSALVILTHLY